MATTMYCLPFQHVSHRRAALWRRHVDRAHFVAGRLVVGAQHRAALPDGVVAKPPSPAITRVFVTSVPIMPGRPVRGIVQAFERGIVADVVRCFAVRDLPEDLALVQIDGGDASVGRLAERQAVHAEVAASRFRFPAAGSAATGSAPAGSAAAAPKIRRRRLCARLTRHCPGRSPYPTGPDSAAPVHRRRSRRSRTRTRCASPDRRSRRASSCRLARARVSRAGRRLC